MRDQLSRADVSSVSLTFVDVTLFALDYNFFKALVLEFFEDANRFRYQDPSLVYMSIHEVCTYAPAVIFKRLVAEFIDCSHHDPA